MNKPRGYVLWEGASAINGAPSVAIATLSSVNTKTGPMSQVWFLVRDELPTKAVESGADEAICGHCAFRPINAKGNPDVATCYVTLVHGPNQIWRGYHEDKYPPMPRDFKFPSPVRFGSYGDPATLPTPRFAALTRRAVHGWTAYTHQWPHRQGLRHYCMASVDSEVQQHQAIQRGWRTFRVIQKNDPCPDPIRYGRPMTRRFMDRLQREEINCPAAQHIWNGRTYATGERTTCAECLLCDGKPGGDHDRRKNITVHAH